MRYVRRTATLPVLLLLVSVAVNGCSDEVKGSIRDADGKPVHRAYVYLSGRRQPKDPHDEPRRVKIGEDWLLHRNTFSFAVPEDAGDLMLLVTHPDYAPVRRRFETAAELKRLSPLRIVLLTGVTVRGAVHGTGGEPVKGARVVLQSKGTVTDAAGRFCIEHLAKGQGMLVVESPPTHKVESTMIRIADGMPELRIAVEPVAPASPPPGGALFDLRGRVLCPDGRPPARVAVRLWYTGRHAYADADGRFAFRSLVAKEYTIEVYASVKSDGQERSPWEGVVVSNVGPDTNDLEIRLPELGGVKLRVVEKETGKAIETFVVEPRYPDAPPAEGWESYTRRKLKGKAVLQWSIASPRVSSASKHPRGEVLIPQLTPGVYHLAVRSEGFVQARPPAVIIEEGKTTDLGTIALERGLTVKGRLVDPDGKPVHEARVSAWGKKAGVRGPSRSETNPRLVFGARTDESGRFALTGVETLDSWHLRIEAHGYWPIARRYGRLTGSTHLGTLRIPEDRRIPLATLSGTVTDENGKPVPAVRLYFRRRTSRESPGSFSDVVYSDLRGRYHVQLAADSEYEVSIEREVRTALGRFSRVRKEARLAVDREDLARDFSLTLHEWKGFEE